MRDDERLRARFTYHGGDLAAARAAFPDAGEPWLDLSTGINGVAYPLPDLSPEAWTALPDPAALAALDAAAARAYGAAPQEVVAAPGTQALISLLPHLRPSRRVGILGLTYSEHARAWRAGGAAVLGTSQLDALAGLDTAVVVNPNNPDGRLVMPDDLRRLATGVGLLVVDEAFMDVAAEPASLAATLPDNVIVLRSFGKTYGLAGLRLGFALTRGLAGSLRAALGPWPVSGPALTIGRRALDDGAWLEKARARLQHDSGRLDALLTRHGARIVGGTALFRLAETPDAAEWFTRLARRAILVRPFAERPRWLRFGLPSTEADWERLTAALDPL